MAQGLIGGDTPYNDQSLSDIQTDINQWQAYTNNIKNFFEKTITKLEEMDYMTKIDFDMRSIFYNTIRITNTFLEDFNTINTSISNGTITERDVKLLRNIGNISIENNTNYGKTFHRGNWKEYEKTNPDSGFRLAEQLYQKGRDFFVTLQDASNASLRLEHYINPTPPSNGTTFNIQGTGHNIQQSVSGNMSMNVQQNNSGNIQEAKALMDEIINNLNQYFDEDYIKDQVKDYIDVIQSEIKEDVPKKSMIKIALKGLQTFNESTQFISTIAELTKLLGYLPK